MEGDRPFVLVHERRDGDAGAATFDDIIAATPAALREAGIYRPIATPLHGGPHADVSYRLILERIDAACGSGGGGVGGILSDALNLTEKLTGLDLDDGRQRVVVLRHEEILRAHLEDAEHRGGAPERARRVRAEEVEALVGGEAVLGLSLIHI